jgi:predicted amidohydrolase
LRVVSAIGRALIGLAALAAAGVLYLHWPEAVAPPAPIAASTFGVPGQRSLIAVEPSLDAADYRSAESLRRALAPYLDEAAARGWITPRSVLVFPEHVGTWLVAAEAPAAVRRARSVAEASTILAAADPLRFIASLRRSPEADRFAASLFRSRSREMAAAYSAVFSSLAKDYRATIVAGSIVLENPAVESGMLVAAPGELFNVAAVFRPDGSIDPALVFKRRPIPSEAGFTAPGAARIPVFDTPAGRMAALICADSWHPDVYREIEKADLLAVPAYLQGDESWIRPWGGYVTGAPDDASAEDVGRLTEGEAWVRYAMPGRIAISRADVGAVAFLRGAPWGLGADGRTLVQSAGRSFVGAKSDGGAVTAIWF